MEEMSSDQYQQIMNKGKSGPKKIRFNSVSGKITESEVQTQILDWLNYNQIYNWRQNTMGVYCGNDNQGNARFRKAPVTGVPDICGVLPGGRFFGIECKRPGGKPTEDQIDFINNINANNGLAFVADNLDIVIEKIGPFIKN